MSLQRCISRAITGWGTQTLPAEPGCILRHLPLLLLWFRSHAQQNRGRSSATKLSDAKGEHGDDPLHHWTETAVCNWLEQGILNTHLLIHTFCVCLSALGSPPTEIGAISKRKPSWNSTKLMCPICWVELNG